MILPGPGLRFWLGTVLRNFSENILKVTAGAGVGRGSRKRSGAGSYRGSPKKPESASDCEKGRDSVPAKAGARPIGTSQTLHQPFQIK